MIYPTNQHIVDQNDRKHETQQCQFSTIFLNLIRAEFMTPSMTMANMLVFVITFFLARLVYGPYAIYQHSYYLYTIGRTSEESKACLPPGFDHVIAIVGMFFNLLNAYWFYKILLKLQRKLKGKEAVKDSNDYTAEDTRKVKFKKEQD